MTRAQIIEAAAAEANQLAGSPAGRRTLGATSDNEGLGPHTINWVNYRLAESGEAEATTEEKAQYVGRVTRS